MPATKDGVFLAEIKKEMIFCILLIGSGLTYSLAYLLWTDNNYRVSGFKTAKESYFFVDETGG